MCERLELRRPAEETKGAAAGLGEPPPDRPRQQCVDAFLPDDGRFECARLRGRLEPELLVEPQAEAPVAAEGLVLRYGSLFASDRSGRSLPAGIEVSGGRLRLLVDDRGAVYPLRIDPLVQVAKLRVREKPVAAMVEHA